MSTDTTEQEHDEARHVLIRIAAAMALGEGFISPFAEDNPKSTPKSVLWQAERQQERLKDWAYRIRQAHDSKERYYASLRAQVEALTAEKEALKGALQKASEYHVKHIGVQIRCALCSASALHDEQIDHAGWCPYSALAAAEDTKPPIVTLHERVRGLEPDIARAIDENFSELFEGFEPLAAEEGEKR